MDVNTSSIERATVSATQRPGIGDLQAMQNAAISELDEVVRVLGNRIDPIRRPVEMKQPMLAESADSREFSPVGAEILQQTSRISDITRYVRVLLSEVEV